MRIDWLSIVNALGDRSLAGRDRSHQAGLRGSSVQPVPGREGRFPNIGPARKSRNLAKSRKCSSREPVSRTRTGLLGTGLSGKDRFPNAKTPLLKMAAFGDRSPRAGTGPSLRKCPERADSKDEKLRGYLQNGLY
uniref:Uncharacterized protein n=1 Tax=Ananas comosus var. bracteatus TaxID=296719 RepID=A0A6V7PVT3_ANACO|nr:unnamed protein product [Ananas comosus var. bracteatus]